MSMLTCNRTVFGSSRPTKLDLMGVRFFAPPPDENGGGGGEFKAPEDQAALDKLINAATAKVHKRYEGFDDLKDKAGKWDAHEQAEAEKGKGGDGDEPKPLTDADVEKRIQDAIAAKDLELAIERAGDALDKALEDRDFSPSLVRNVDLKQFVKDGRVDKGALETWVKDNTSESEKPKPRRDPSQGQRGTGDGGSVQAGRDLFDSRHNKSKKQ